MRKADADEIVQSLLFECVKYAQEERLLDIDIVIRGMKKYIHSYEADKKRRRSVQLKECHGNLAWTTNSLSSPQELTSSVLFFVSDSSMDNIEKDSEYIGLRCIICNAPIQMEVKRN